MKDDERFMLDCLPNILFEIYTLQWEFSVQLMNKGEKGNERKGRRFQYIGFQKGVMTSFSPLAEFRNSGSLPKPNPKLSEEKLPFLSFPQK